MEEIDIIELLQRVKEGKAPKEIEIKEYRYKLNDFGNYYREDIDGEIYHLTDEQSIFDMIIFNTKIKILDKPIIEELSEETIIGKEGSIIKAPTNMALMFKINEIIKWINEKN